MIQVTKGLCDDYHHSFLVFDIAVIFQSCDSDWTAANARKPRIVQVYVRESYDGMVVGRGAPVNCGRRDDTGYAQVSGGESDSSR